MSDCPLVIMINCISCIVLVEVLISSSASLVRTVVFVAYPVTIKGWLLQNVWVFLARCKVAVWRERCNRGSESGVIVSQGVGCSPGQPCPTVFVLYRVICRLVGHAMMKFVIYRPVGYAMMKFNKSPNE